MNKPEIDRALRNLNELDVENLQCGRITKNAMHEAAVRVAARGEDEGVSNIGLPGSFASFNEMKLADELNDMLQAAKEREAWASP